MMVRRAREPRTSRVSCIICKCAGFAFRSTAVGTCSCSTPACVACAARCHLRGDNDSSPFRMLSQKLHAPSL